MIDFFCIHNTLVCFFFPWTSLPFVRRGKQKKKNEKRGKERIASLSFARRK
jgi:hypothetical protein